MSGSREICHVLLAGYRPGVSQHFDYFFRALQSARLADTDSRYGGKVLFFCSELEIAIRYYPSEVWWGSRTFQLELRSSRTIQTQWAPEKVSCLHYAISANLHHNLEIAQDPGILELITYISLAHWKLYPHFSIFGKWFRFCSFGWPEMGYMEVIPRRALSRLDSFELLSCLSVYLLLLPSVYNVCCYWQVTLGLWRWLSK